jgi:hypothetical protein
MQSLEKIYRDADKGFSRATSGDLKMLLPPDADITSGSILSKHPVSMSIRIGPKRP